MIGFGSRELSERVRLEERVLDAGIHIILSDPPTELVPCPEAVHTESVHRATEQAQPEPARHRPGVLWNAHDDPINGGIQVQIIEPRTQAHVHSFRATDIGPQDIIAERAEFDQASP